MDSVDIINEIQNQQRLYFSKTFCRFDELNFIFHAFQVCA